MRKNLIVLLPLLIVLAACVPQTPPPPPVPPPAAPPPPPPPPVADVAPEPGSGPKWDVTRVTCGQLLGAHDEDRAAAIMFYYGYLAASSNIKVIDVSMIEQNVRRVMDKCVEAPNLTIPQAYRLAFGRHHHPRHHPRRR